MAIKILADSLADLPQSVIEKYSNIEIIPLTIMFGEEEFKDGVDISTAEFYGKLRSSKELPKTSQVTPSEFQEVFERSLTEFESVIYISGSSRATGTYQSACIAKQEMENENIHIFDSMELSFGCGLFVVEALELVEKGSDAQTILSKLEELRGNIDYIFTVDTLEYLQKGGRLSSTKAAIGSILNIKPILKVVDGKPEQVGSVRGKKKVIAKMIEMISSMGKELDGATVGVFHGDNIEGAEKLKEEILKKTNPKEIIMGEVGSVVGTHSGPGILAVFYKK